ncbi:isoleucyl-tRNA synthetase [Sarocladium implicatum]|nr:isoleucyl-tRNA synthetase [Sarocladium implicatum]
MNSASIDHPLGTPRATDDTGVPSLNIAILTFGTRGDVQPYLRITQELLSCGHRVRLVVPPTLEPWIRAEYGFETWCHGHDMRLSLLWGMQKPREKILSFVDGRYWKMANEQADEFVEYWRACVDGGGGGDDAGTKIGQAGARPFVADTIIASPPVMMHVHIAQRLGVPMFLTHFNPKTPTREWPHGESQPSDKTFLPCDENLESWQTGDSKAWRFYYKRLVNRVRQHHLDLPTVGSNFFPAQFNDLKLQITYLFSQHVLPRPDDFPQGHQLAGYTFLEQPQDFRPDRYLEDFLSGSDSLRKIYVDFGSNEHLDKVGLTAMIVSAIQANGARAIFQALNVFVTDALPHSWLFPHIDLVLHAGGAGMTAMVLRNGLPSAMMPFRGDQFLWCRTVERLGAGPAAVGMKDMTKAKLTALLKEAFDEKCRLAAQKVGEAIRKEPDGAGKAMKMFHEHLSDISGFPPRCSLLSERQAVWTWSKQTYNQQYEKWVPWLEDQYLRWFTKDNKTSYTAKQNLDKTKVTGIDQVDTLQDGVNHLAAGQVGQGGLLQPVGDLASKEGMTRAERQGKDDKGGYAPSNIPGAETANSAVGGIADGGKAAGGKVMDGAKGAGSYVGGMFGGGKKEEQK